MSGNIISGINSTMPGMAGIYSNQVAKNNRLTSTKSQDENVEKSNQSSVTFSSKTLTNISLKFQVNASTNDVTILVLDKESKEVIRTIPPEELQNLREGDLFELTT